jgi:hypothetical protein
MNLFNFSDEEDEDPSKYIEDLSSLNEQTILVTTFSKARIRTKNKQIQAN